MNNTLLKTFDEDGKCHREGSPAVVILNYDVPDTLTEGWCDHGLFHRDDGPAVINSSVITGEVKSFMWYYLGRLVTINEWCDLLNKTEAERTYYHMHTPSPWYRLRVNDKGIMYLEPNE